MLNGSTQDTAAPPPRIMEWLDRGMVALELDKGVFLSWRALGTDDDHTGFNLYRNGGKITDLALTGASNYIDPDGTKGDRYAVEVVSKDDILDKSNEIPVWPRKAASHEGAKNKRVPPLAYLEIPVDAPTEQHKIGDASVGDLDGDGDYELIFEWEGVPPFLDAVTLEGKRLWRIGGGPNTDRQKLAFMVYDFDGDGKAEVACKTGPGTRDGTGRFLNKGPAASDDDGVVLERKSGRLVEDPSYISVFKGSTGKELATTSYWPPIGPRDEMKATWGDNYGHRSASIKSAVLYQKESYPLMVFARGIYTRIAMGSYRWDGKTLEQVWTFDSEDPEHPEYRAYRGQGNHSLAVGDVDNDGSDEIIYGACAIDHDGTGLYSTGFGHGDSHALGDLMPDHPGLEFYQGHEGRDHGVSMRDAATGEILWEIKKSADVGRAWAANVNPGIRGAECTSSATPNLDCNGNEIDTRYSAYAQPILFDGDPEHELRSRTVIEGGPNGRIFQGWHYRASNIHSSKHDACLVADIVGDWREEIVYPRGDKKALIVFTTWLPTERRNFTLMHDPTYRMNVAVQGIGYNQPSYPGFYFAGGQPKSSIRYLPAVVGRHAKPQP
ncbi:MAG: rhamnogalacturonan lyase [Verrucomicrobiae bacterium]|nr:rhamnogalacturonan lyase [Verrucomicrobiae bacterium]